MIGFSPLWPKQMVIWDNTDFSEAVRQTLFTKSIRPEQKDA
jgi:hypothetical protein